MLVACNIERINFFNNCGRIFHRYLLEHLVRVCRILRTPGGHGLLVGVGGSGRQSLTRLAASMGGLQVYQPEISKNYGIYLKLLKISCLFNSFKSKLII